MNWQRDELLHEVLWTPRRKVLLLDDTVVLDRANLLQIITPSLKSGGINEVAWCRFTPTEADACIDEGLARFTAAGVRFRWAVSPDCGPPDLALRLSRRGLEAQQIIAMTRFLDAPLGKPDLKVERVESATVSEYTQVMVEGWGANAEPMGRLNRMALTTPSLELFLARIDGEPAGVASSVLTERSVYLMGGVVLPRFRGRGLYRALVNTRLRRALETGRSLAFAHAMAETSAPRLGRLGFSELFRFTSFCGPRVDQ